MAVSLTGFGITALMGSILPFPSLLPLPPFSISDKSRSLPPSTDRPTLVAHFRKLVLKCTNARLELLINLNYERTWWVTLFYLWMTRRDLTMLIYDNSALESPVPSIQHCHQSDCRAHHRGRERVIPFFSPKVPFKLSQQPQKKKEKRKETDFPPVIPLCARFQSPLRKSRVHPISICQRQGTTTNRAPIFTSPATSVAQSWTGLHQVW